jgi:hypothetical protein
VNRPVILPALATQHSNLLPLQAIYGETITRTKLPWPTRTEGCICREGSNRTVSIKHGFAIRRIDEPTTVSWACAVRQRMRVGKDSCVAAHGDVRSSIHLNSGLGDNCLPEKLHGKSPFSSYGLTGRER